MSKLKKAAGAALLFGFLRKKKETKKEFKPNTLSKVLNVLPFLPLLILLLTALLS